MKKLIFIIFATLVIAILGSALALSGAAETADNTLTARVTICDGSGALALPYAEVEVTDADSDGRITINDALICAHEIHFEGGAATGYGFEQTYYGLSLTRLWGVENGGAYGYYHNNKAPQSLADEISDGDLVSAFVYTDLVFWSDLYCYFTVAEASVLCGEEITLTLLSTGFDENFAPVLLPVSGATLTVNGEATDLLTDEMGAVTLTLDGEGEYLISALSQAQNLVPPVCILTASEPQEAPPTGDGAALWLITCAVLLALALVLIPKRGKNSR